MSAQLDADAFPDLCERFQLESVPAFLFLHAGSLIDSVMGADVPVLVNKVKQHSLTASIASSDASMLPAATAPPPATSSTAAAAKPPLDERLRALTSQAPVVLFMKGDETTPRCGFSRQAVELLRGEHVAFATFDILSDEEVRQGLKKFSNWPTYPQLYGDGKLVGGLDIMKECARAAGARMRAWARRLARTSWPLLGRRHAHQCPLVPHPPSHSCPALGRTRLGCAGS